MGQSPLSQASDDRLLDMLFAGEEIEEEIELSHARIAVTSHRLLAFMPEGGERRFDHEDRPNVLDARVQAAGRPDYLSWCVRSFVYGLLLVGGGYLLNSSGLLTDFGGPKAPTGQIVGVQQMIGTVVSAFSLLTSLLLLVGGILVFAAIVFGVLYFFTRSEELIIERAGRDPIRIPVDDTEAEDAARRIREAVGTHSKPSAG